MYFVYILKSEDSKELYIGYTHDLKKRVSEHNRLQSFHTRKSAPWKLVYFEGYGSRFDAIEREKKLKQFGSAYAGLKRRLKNSIE